MIEETHPAGAPADSPVESDAPTEDRIGTAWLAMLTGATAAVVWYAVLTWIQTRFLLSSTVTSVSQVDPHSFDVNFFVYGALLGSAFSGVVAWTLMFAIPSSYRRGGLSLVAAFAGSVIAAVLTSIIRFAAGGNALLALALMAALLAIWLGRRTIASVR